MGAGDSCEQDAMGTQKFHTYSIIFKKLDNTTIIIEGKQLARHLGSTQSKYLTGCNTGISILIGLAMVARHILTL